MLVANKEKNRDRNDASAAWPTLFSHRLCISPSAERLLTTSKLLSVAPGERVAILGSMGVGKSTLNKLVMNFYQPTSGAIRIDGTDINQIDPADLRRHIGYVPQDSRLFFGTVRDNIAFKAPWLDDADILRAAKISGADHFINRHPAGYDMPIGEGGTGLSGGQAQAICVARSLLLDPSILLFDEPTSSMDSGTEARFLNSIKCYSEGKTLLLVTHKIPLLKLVDRIIVLQQGKVAADGPRDQVLKALQALNYEEEDENNVG